MAPKKFRGRKALFRRRKNRFLFRGRWWKIVYFDGYGLRHMQPDIDIMLWHGDGNNDFVPPRQLWLDRRYRAQTAFWLEVFQIEKMKKWTKRGDNDRYPPYKALREYLKEKLCKKGPIPDFVEREEWNAEHQVNIVYVRGDIVRKWYDPHFVFGGHDLVYHSYITTPKTIWIDVCQDPREIKYTLVHEALERKLMERGWRYGPAHASAIRAETKLRAMEYVNVDKEEELMSLKPLKVKPIEQSDVGCGPTSAKMLLDYDGIVKEDGAQYTEEELITLCGCDPEMGTDHAPLVEGMRKIAGDRVVHGENAAIEDLKRIVLQERRPVMIGWWVDDHLTEEAVRANPDLDGGHYSVVSHLNAQRVWIADPWIIDPDADEDDEDDPGGAPGIRKLSHKEFLERWYDMDGSPTETDPGYHIVRGWYLYLRAPEPADPKP